MSGREQIFTGSKGVAVMELEVRLDLEWIFRAQSADDDFGIDAHIESVRGDVPTGRLLAAQLKSSKARYSDESAGGWWKSIEPRHAEYWLGHSLPVVMILVDLTARRSYWAHVNATTLQPAGKGFKIWVPSTQRVNTAKEAWSELLDSSVIDAITRFEENLAVLPPTSVKQLRTLREKHPTTAAQLAALLAAHRTTPGEIATIAMTDYIRWLESGGKAAWLAVGQFAREHDEYEIAAQAFESAGRADSDYLARGLATAASMLSDIDQERAVSLLTEAIAADDQNLVVRVATATLWPDRLDPESNTFDQKLLDDLTFASDDELALFYLAQRAAMHRHENEAIRLFTSALALAPDVSQGMTLLSHCHIRRAVSKDATGDDWVQALEWAQQALDQRRRWTNNTATAVSAILQSLGSLFRFEDAIAIAAPPPYGSGKPDEFGDFEVARLLLQIAKDAGREDLFDAIIEGVPRKKQRKQLRVEVNLAGLLDENRKQALLELLGHSAKGDPQQFITPVVELASLGVDKSEWLQSLADSGALPAYYPAMIAAISRSVEDPRGDLLDLRKLADDDPLAASALINALIRSDRNIGALKALSNAGRTFGGQFIENEVRLLVQLDRISEATTRLEVAIRDGQVSGALLTNFLISLAQQHASLGNAAEARPLYERAAPSDTGAAWSLAACEFELGHFDAARRTIDRYHLTPESPHEIRLWSSTMSLTGWSQVDAETACAVAESLVESDPDLAIRIALSLTVNTQAAGGSDDDEHLSTVDARPRVRDEVHQRAHAIIAEIQDSTGVLEKIDLPEDDPAALAERLAELARPADPDAFRDLIRMTLLGRVPLSFLARAFHRSYALTVCAGGLGVTVSSAADANTHEAETQTARAWLANAGSVVSDASALSLARDLGEFDRLRLGFSNVYLSMSARRDIAQARLDARGFTASVGSLGWDDFTGRPTFTKADPSSQLRLLQCAEQLERDAEKLTAVSVTGEPEFTPEIADMREHEWVESIELAGRQRAAIWSDDVAHRELARSLSIPAFGTANLLEALLVNELNDSEAEADVNAYATAQAELVRSLIRLGAVDQPSPPSEIIELLRSPEGPGRAHLILTRPHWWAEHEFTSWSNLRAVLRAEAGRDTTRVWLRAAMEGLTFATEHQPELGARLLAAVAILGVEQDPTVEDAAEYLTWADRAARNRDPRPSDALEWVTTQLGGGKFLPDAETFAREVRERLNKANEASADDQTGA